MDLGKLLDSAKQNKKNVKNGKPIESAKKESISQPIKKVQSTPALTVFNPPKSTQTVKSVAVVQEEFDYQEFVSLDESEKVDITSIALSDLSSEKGRNSACHKLSSIVRNSGMKSAEGVVILEFVVNIISAKMDVNPKSKDGAYELCNEIMNTSGKSLEPYLLPHLFQLFTSHGDRSQIVRDNASSIILKLAEIISPHSFRIIYPFLLSGMNEEDWRIKVATLQFIKSLAPRVSKQLSPLLPQLIPAISECICDPKRQVQVIGMEAMIEACQVITNDDIRPIVPQLVSVIANPDESTKTLDLLLETTFVAVVDASVLALIAPTLGKALRGRLSALKRKAARVIDIMCRLVQDPSHVTPFEPLLLPALDKVIDEIVDSEVCDVAKAARLILTNALKGLKTDSNGIVHDMAQLTLKDKSYMELLDLNEVKTNLYTAFHTVLNTQIQSKYDIQAVEYIAHLCSYLIIYCTLNNPNTPLDVDITQTWRYAVAMSDFHEWKECILPYLHLLYPTKLSEDIIQTLDLSNIDETNQEAVNYKYYDILVHHIRSAALSDVPDAQHDDEADDTSLCNIEFSLAFGGKILLQNTHLKLGRGKKYGIMGKNGAGKTTLLTNIANGAVEGLPSHIRTIYVQHDDSTDDQGISVIDELLNTQCIQEVNATREEALSLLHSIHFTDIMINSPRSALSGGWKMKLMIIKAMLSKANVLLLDEPTNHLDKASVGWLTKYLNDATDITCLIVTHDTEFMDNVVTDIIHYENRKLVYYHGNLTHFVKIHPEAKYYYDLTSSNLKSKFPIPDRLDGINSNTRAIMRMENMSYTYPGKTEPTIKNVNVKVCLGSRIAVLGANGAGKSTLVRVLVGETEADEGSGEVWRHMNLRLAYVAQHSLHHVEQHLESSPVDYIKWRFHGGVDRENLEKDTMKMSIEEEDHREKKFGDVDLVVGRRKNGRTMEYECTFIGQTHRDPNKYITVEKMNEMGLGKLVQQCDARVAAMAAGLDLRPLVTTEIQGHLNDFNLDSEFGTHSKIKRLSGGQKVKLVLAAAMWNKPHVIVLDEPTNYLDREALGALTQAIKEFAGGVVIISHNSEFTSAICNETWLVKDGTCYSHGEANDSAVIASSGVKKSKSAPQLVDGKDKDDSGGNINKAINNEIIMNPRTLEPLSKKEIRKLERLAIVAGMSLKEYVGKINCKSPEWKWL